MTLAATPPELLDAALADLPTPSSPVTRWEWMNNTPQAVAPLNRIWEKNKLGSKRFFGSLNLALRSHNPSSHEEWEEAFTANLLLPSRKYWGKQVGEEPAIQPLHPDFAGVDGGVALRLIAARILNITHGTPGAGDADFSAGEFLNLSRLGVRPQEAIDLAYARIVDGAWNGWQGELGMRNILTRWLSSSQAPAGCVSVRLATDYEDAVFAVDGVILNEAGLPVWGVQSKADSAAALTPAVVAAARRNETRNRGFLTTFPSVKGVLYLSASDVARGVLRKRKLVSRDGVTVFLPSRNVAARPDVRVELLGDGIRP